MNAHEIYDTPNEAQGFIGIYTHAPGAMEFVQVGDDQNHGYYRVAKPELVLEERHMKNLIVSKASTFMAKRMRPGANWGSGIGYLEIGTGVGTGTAQSPQSESSGQTALRVPLTRKAITSWTCLDGTGAPTATDTNVLQITTTFIESEANGALVEMALWGGDATNVSGSGMIFNYKTFSAINKNNTMQVTIVWKLTF